MPTVTDLLDLFGIRFPIVQDPMAGVSTPSLAAAVSGAGGLGSLGLGSSDADAAREAIRATKAFTAQPFNVNVFCHRPATPDPAREKAWLDFLRPRFAEVGAAPPASLREIYRSFLDDEAMLQVLLEERPGAVSFHFGLPPIAWIRRLQQAGIVTLACATSLDEAMRIDDAGVDVIVTQGVEAGGHRGSFEPGLDEQIGTLPLVRMVVRKTSRPVIAAGGIMDGAGIHAALALGAAAVQMGTAFILCPESAADSGYRQQLQSTRASHTRVTPIFSGRAARGIVNGMTDLLDVPDRPAIPDYPIAYDAAKALHAAAKARGNLEYGAYWAGQGAPLARAMPAAQLVATLVDEWHAGQRV
jgi:nitronate monooxygenase